MIKHDLSAVAFLTLTELIGCIAVAIVLGIAYGCSISDVITVRGAISLLMLCVGVSIIAVALSHREKAVVKKRPVSLKEKGA